MHQILPVGMKAQRDEDGGRILPCNNMGSRAVMLRPIRFHCLEFGFQVESLVYTYIADHMYIIFNLHKFDVHRTFGNVTTA